MTHRGDRVLRALLALPGWVIDKLEPAPEPVVPPTDREALRALVRSAARWPEAHLAMEEGLGVFQQGDAVLAYQVRGGTVFGIGGLNGSDPVGLLRAFARSLAGARRTLVFPLREEELAFAAAASFTSLQVGVEAWLDLPGLTWRGRRFDEARHARNKAARGGVLVEEVRPEGVADELQAIHAAWLASKRPSWRMKLLVGSPGLEDPGDRRYLVARAPRRIEAFVTLLPGGPGVWGVDVICRRPDALPGSVEALLMAGAERLQREGATALSLGPCPMAGVQHQGLTGALFRALYRTSLGNRVFGFRNLHRFKKKFQPRWEPIYIGAAPRLGWFELYAGCRMWGLY